MIEEQAVKMILKNTNFVILNVFNPNESATNPRNEIVFT